MRTLKERVAVVTGAAGGIGRATAVALAKAGCALALVDVDEVGLAATAESVRAAGRVASVHVLSVSDRAAMMALPEAVIAAHGAVHVLVNNAGVNMTAPFAEATLEDFDWVLGVNLMGVVHGCKAFLPHLRAADEGHIINVSSAAAMVGMPTQSAYCASKAAVRAFSESLYTELGGTRVGVSCVMPGTTRTGILANGRASDSELKARLVGLMARYAPGPERVARAIVRAIRGSQPEVVVCPDAHALAGLNHTAPTVVRGALRWLGGRVG
jgi:NAD(P)-dependent dehydrogenase (short-subunit alcohol dehydrogenase family)